MGILNITPDSFSDGGRFTHPESALRRALSMVEEGADIIDIGGESSRPGAEAVGLNEELDRVIPVIELIRENSDICISIDTYKAGVMREAVSAGAALVNDITALESVAARKLVAELKVPVCLMHMQGTPQTMQDKPFYASSVTDEIHQFFISRIQLCIESGIVPEQIILDPGFGFGKTVRHNLQILQRVAEFTMHQRPLLLGVSRKSTIGEVLQKKVEERMVGSLSASLFAAFEGVSLLRTHDVSEMKQGLQMIDAILSA